MTEYNRLIAYGDSFVHGDGLRTRDQTRPNYWERHSPDSWPHLLGNKLGIPTINRGIPGGSNFGSAHVMLRDCTELNINPTDLVYVLLSHPGRIPIPVNNTEWIYESSVHFSSAKSAKFLQDIGLLVTPRQIAEARTLDAVNLIRMITSHTGCTLRIFWGWFDLHQVEFPKLYDIPVDINQRSEGKIHGLTSELDLASPTHKTKCGHWNERGHQRVAEHIFEYEQVRKANGSVAYEKL